MARNADTTAQSARPSAAGRRRAPPRKKTRASSGEEREGEQLGPAEVAVDLVADLLAGDGGPRRASRPARAPAGASRGRPRRPRQPMPAAWP